MSVALSNKAIAGVIASSGGYPDSQPRSKVTFAVFGTAGTEDFNYIEMRMLDRKLTSPHHLAMEVFKSAAGINVVHVPYKGTAGAVQELLGGQINVMFLPVHVALPLVEAGKLNMLAAGGAERASATPNVPSLAEAAGVGDVDTDIWYALYAPAGTSPDIVAKLNTEMNRVLKDPATIDTLTKQGLQPTGGSPGDLAKLTRSDLDRWATVIRQAKIEPD